MISRLTSRLFRARAASTWLASTSAPSILAAGLVGRAAAAAFSAAPSPPHSLTPTSRPPPVSEAVSPDGTLPRFFKRAEAVRAPPDSAADAAAYVAPAASGPSPSYPRPPPPPPPPMGGGASSWTGDRSPPPGGAPCFYVAPWRGRSRTSGTPRRRAAARVPRPSPSVSSVRLLRPSPSVRLLRPPPSVSVRPSVDPASAPSRSVPPSLADRAVSGPSPCPSSASPPRRGTGRRVRATAPPCTRRSSDISPTTPC